MAELIVGSVAKRLSELLIHEAAVLSKVESRVEDIRRELVLMKAFLKDIESHGRVKDKSFIRFVEELNDVARNAGNVIETFLDISVRMPWIFSFVKRYKVGKEVERISERVREMYNRMKYEQSHLTNIGLVVETLPETSHNVASPYAERISKKMMIDMPQRREKYDQCHQTNLSVEDETLQAASCNVASPYAEPISKKMMIDMPQRRKKYDQSHLTNLSVVDENHSASCNVASEAPAVVEKLWYILSKNLVANFEVKNVVEEVKDDVVSMVNVVSDLKSKEQSGEREKVWLEEASTVCNFTISVIEDFITRSEGFPIAVLKCLPTLPYWQHPSERKLMKEMKYIKTQVQGALLRRLTYGVGEEDVGDQIGLTYGVGEEDVAYKIEPTPKVQIPQSIEQAFLESIPMVLLIKYCIVTLRSIGSMGMSADQKLESIQRELALMHAFFRDIRSVEGLNERQKVWVNQIRDVAQQAEALLNAYELKMNKGVLRRLFQHIAAPQYEEEINYILYKMRNNWERKTIYDIANIEGRQGLVSLGQTMHGSGSEIQIVVEHNDSSSTEEDPLLPAGMSNNNWLVKGQTEKVVESIREDMELMKALFLDAQEIGELDGRSRIWVEQMRAIADEIEYVSNKYDRNLEDKAIHMRILNFPRLHIIQSKINRIRNSIQEALRIRKRYGLIHLQTRAESSSMVQRLRGRTQPPLNVRESNIIGFDEDVEVLMGKLLSDEKNRCITSIIGIEGIGKTTLARLIFDNVAIKDHFDYRVWVSARQDSVKVECKTEQIMSDQEATQTGKEDSTQILEKFLKKKGCLILIVVDDVQTPLIWDTLKKTIPDMSTGCRLLLTSRSAKVVNLHAGQRTFMNQLLLLDDDNSWVLFKRNLKIDIPPELIKVGKEIAIKCGGLPSEILKIGDELSKKDITDKEWSSMLQQLNQYRKPWSETLETIDTNLPPCLMRCLYYFVLFPAEFEIPTRRLIVLWVAEGLVHHGQDQEAPEQVAERYLAKLIELNVVQIAKRNRNGKVKTCRLPNALRESSLLRRRTGTDSDSVSKKFIIRQVADHLDKNDICYNHIHSDIVTTSATMKSLYKDVMSFLSFDTRGEGKPGKDIGKFLDRCISRGCFLQLRVLDLERVYKPQLPENIARLSQLRYLGLRWTYLESLPSSISSLLKLQTLDLKHTYISILPSSIWKMQLRHLFLSETYRTRFPPHRRGNSLTDLQTLWGLFVDEKAPVKCGLDRLVNIRKLGLACQSMSLGEEEMTKQLDAVAEWILNLKYLQSLGLKSRKEDGQPGDLHLGSLKTHTELTDMYLLGILKSPSIKSVFPPSLNELTLSHSNLQKDSIEILGDLPFLQSLCLLAGSYIEETLHCKKGSFPQLYVLKLWKLKELKEWNIEEEAFPHLRQLEIRSCECLQMLPVGLEHISTLRELKLTTMSKNFVERVRGVDKHKIPSSCNALNCYIIAGEQQFTCNSLF